MRRLTGFGLALALAAGVPLAPGTASAQEHPEPPPEKPTDEVAVRNIVRTMPPQFRWRPAGSGYLGVRLEDVTEASMDELGLSELRGARVEAVSEGSPAAEAGLQEGDVVLRFDGEEVRSVAHLVRLVRETPPGREVQLRVMRDGETRSLSLEVSERSSPWLAMDERSMKEVHRKLERALEGTEGAMSRLHEHVREGGFEFDDGETSVFFHRDDRARLGVRLQPVTDQLADYFGVSDGHGALVASVRDGSPAAEAGLRAGDVLVAVGDEEIRDPGDAVRAVRHLDAGAVDVTVVRDGEERTLGVELPERSRHQHDTGKDEETGR